MSCPQSPYGDGTHWCVQCDSTVDSNEDCDHPISPEDQLFKKLKDFVTDFASEPCTYGDNCPPFAGTRHGDCLPCRARDTLGIR